MRKLLTAVFVTATSLGLAGSVLAADYLQGISASPPVQQLQFPAGASYSGSVQISNPGKTAYNFTVSSSPFFVSGESYNLQFSKRPDLVDASKWFTFPTNRFHLNPGQEVPVQYVVHVPKDAAGGGYYAVVFAQADPPPGPGGGVTGQKRVGVLTYMTVSGDIHREGHIASFAAPWIQTAPPLHSELRMQNTGNVHFDATASEQVMDLFGNVKYEQEVTDVTFPKTTRRIDLDWSKSPGFGLYRLAGTVKYLDRTEQLPTTWTLMLSANAFLIIAAVLVALGLFAFLTHRGRGNVRRG